MYFTWVSRCCLCVTVAAGCASPLLSSSPVCHHCHRRCLHATAAVVIAHVSPLLSSFPVTAAVIVTCVSLLLSSLPTRVTATTVIARASLLLSSSPAYHHCRHRHLRITVALMGTSGL